jgi:hypothetical protein
MDTSKQVEKKNQTNLRVKTRQINRMKTILIMMQQVALPDCVKAKVGWINEVLEQAKVVKHHRKSEVHVYGLFNFCWHTNMDDISFQRT